MLYCGEFLVLPLCIVRYQNQKLIPVLDQHFLGGFPESRPRSGFFLSFLSGYNNSSVGLIALTGASVILLRVKSYLFNVKSIIET